MTELPSSSPSRSARIDDNPNVLRVAQYVRMSTDHQRYSTANQVEAIAAYAARRNFEIIRTYADEGRSGLTFQGRGELRRLIQDVQTKQSGFEAILVYDVSRWGRFQDADESAYYEFICKQAGIQVLYCAEQFENDGSLFSTMSKNMKRAMAGEWSRDLSVKVFVGQCRIVTLGFFPGGSAGYGLRRQMLDESGTPKALLEAGQRKSLQTDRVILIPGPQCEVRTVRRIFKSFAIQRKSRSEIAGELNAEHIYNAHGKPWSMQTIDNLLRNERYIGHNVYNRTSFKLQNRHIVNPPDIWIRRNNAFEAIIAPEIFAQTQKLIAQRRVPSDQEVLDHLSALWRKKGRLSQAIISAARTVPHSSVYVRRFGSLMTTYKRIGFQQKPKYRFAETGARIESVISSVADDIILNVEGLGGKATYLSELHLLTINDELKVSVCAAWSISDGSIRARRWQVRKLKYKKTDLTLIIRMDAPNAKIRDYFWFPTVHLALSKDNRLRMSAHVFSETYRHDSLDAFYRMCARSH